MTCSLTRTTISQAPPTSTASTIAAAAAATPPATPITTTTTATTTTTTTTTKAVAMPHTALQKASSALHPDRPPVLTTILQKLQSVQRVLSSFKVMDFANQWDLPARLQTHTTSHRYIDYQHHHWFPLPTSAQPPPRSMLW